MVERKGSDTTGNDYLIYSDFCKYFFDNLAEDKIDTVVLREETDIHDSIREIYVKEENITRLQAFLPTLEASTLSDFFRQNSSNIQLPSKLVEHKQIIILSKANEQAIFKEGGWDKFRDKFHGSQGIMTFSRIGYSKERKQALLSYSNYCGRLCGGGGLAYFRNIEGKWKLEVIFPVWVS